MYVSIFSHHRLPRGILDPVGHPAEYGSDRHCPRHVSGLDDPSAILLGEVPEWEMERVPGDRIENGRADKMVSPIDLRMICGLPASEIVVK